MFSAIAVRYVLWKLKEASTWSGIVKFISGCFGVAFSDDLTTAMVAAGVAISGIFSVLQKEPHAISDIEPRIKP